MKPPDAVLDADVAREEVRVGFDGLTGLVGGHARYGEIARLAQQVRGEVNRPLAPDHRTDVAPQAPLVLVAAVAVQGPLQDVPPDEEQAVQKVGIEKLPGVLAPFFERVVAHQFVDIEEHFDLGQNFVSGHVGQLFIR